MGGKDFRLPITKGRKVKQSGKGMLVIDAFFTVIFIAVFNCISFSSETSCLYTLLPAHGIQGGCMEFSQILGWGLELVQVSVKRELKYSEHHLYCSL